MTSVYDQLLMKLKNGEVKAGSALKVRSETIQNRIKLKRIEKLKREIKKRSKLMVPLEIAVPFNPFTGKEDENFNVDNKYRPLMSATTSSILLKKMAAENEDVKNTFMSRAGVNEWDLSNTDDLNEQDKMVFRLYRVPRIFTIPVITIVDQRITGFEWGMDFTVSINRDLVTGTVIGDYPVALQANKFYQDLAYEEINNINSSIEAAKEGKPYQLISQLKELRQFPNLADILDKDIKEIRRAVYSKVPVSSDRPSNYIVLYEMDLQNDLSVANPATYATLAPEELDKMSRITKVTTELNEAFDKFKNGTYSKIERHYDFWELDMVCPTLLDDPNSAMELGKKTRYEAPQTRIIEEEFYPQLASTLVKALDDTEDLENRFLYSARVKKLDDSVERKILDAIASNNELENAFLTKKVLEANATFVSLCYGEAGDILLTEAQLGMKEGLQEGQLDETASASMAKDVNVNDIIGGDSEESEETVAGDTVATDTVATDISAETISL